MPFRCAPHNAQGFTTALQSAHVRIRRPSWASLITHRLMCSLRSAADNAASEGCCGRRTRAGRYTTVRRSRSLERKAGETISASPAVKQVAGRSTYRTRQDYATPVVNAALTDRNLLPGALSARTVSASHLSCSTRSEHWPDQGHLERTEDQGIVAMISGPIKLMTDVLRPSEEKVVA